MIFRKRVVAGPQSPPARCRVVMSGAGQARPPTVPARPVPRVGAHGSGDRGCLKAAGDLP